jgi:L-ribulose-5-phosphate 3-epimerase
MRVGIMQGRLSPPGARPQSFPFDSWQIEFQRAQSYGFDLIEWLFAAADYERNPIWTESGLADIRRSAMATGVSVASICADYFVDHQIVRVPADERRRHLQTLNVLIERAAQLDARVIVLPVLDAGELRDATDDAILLESLMEPLALAHSRGVTLALESNTPADRYLSLVTHAAHPALSICFDTGNRVAQGLDILADIHLLAPYVSEVHIKDRLLKGPNVPLGEGAAPLDAFLDAVTGGLYSGPLILDKTVGDDYERHAKRNLSFTRLRTGASSPVPVDADA